MTMSSLPWNFNRVLADTPHAFLARVEAPIFIVQFALIAVAGIAAFWLTIFIRPALTKLALKHLPRNWAPTFLRVCASVAPPFFWLVALGLAGTTAGLMGYVWLWANAAMALLLAWVCIRLLSFFVQSPLVSATISIVAWSIASLSILGWLDPLVHYLDSTAITPGKRPISALTAVHAIFIMAALLWLTTLLFRFLQRQIMRSESLTPSLQVLFIQLLQIFLPALAIVIALQAVGVDLTALTVVFGAAGLGIGLGLQRLVANLVAGLTLLVGKTIKPGDIIEYKNGYGWVTAMGARYVTLRTRDGVEHLVPNDYFLENGVENWSYSDARLRLHVPVGIAYESDVRKAIALCVEAAKKTERVLKRPEPICLLREFGDSSVNLEIRFWIEDPRNGTTNVKSEVMLQVWDSFHEVGITFPFPQRDVHIVSTPPGSGSDLR
ncbi:MAG: mechanosensitive ion channel [Alphaproteobacteria bacterium]|nr:mechanosensitive ion channel [Alphaproteobacteria bacterium]